MLKKWQTYLSVFLKATIVVGAVLCLVQGHYQLAVSAVVITGLTLLPVVLRRRFEVTIPQELELLAILFIYGTLYLGNVRGYYERFWWWDGLLHTGSGFMLGILGFLLVFVLNERKEVGIGMKAHFVAIFAFTFSVALGTLWEIFEFTLDGLFGMNMQESGLVDTMWDLIVDSLGALGISLIGWKRLRRRGGGSFIERWIRHFTEKNPTYFRPEKR